MGRSLRGEGVKQRKEGRAWKAEAGLHLNESNSIFLTINSACKFQSQGCSVPTKDRILTHYLY